MSFSGPDLFAILELPATDTGNTHGTSAVCSTSLAEGLERWKRGDEIGTAHQRSLRELFKVNQDEQ